MTEASVLLVEDNPADVELMLYAWRKLHQSIPIHVVRDGAEALEYLLGTEVQPEKPCFVMLDLKLPLVDGLEVLRQVKSDPRTHDIPIVILTSSREDRDVRTSYALGANSYVVKPVRSEQLTETVRELGRYWSSLNYAPQ